VVEVDPVCGNTQAGESVPLGGQVLFMVERRAYPMMWGVMA
jgi:hypothetical protein